MTPWASEPTFRSLGVDGRASLDALRQQAMNAYEDQCAPAKPRTPMLYDMRELMRTAYYGSEHIGHGRPDAPRQLSRSPHTA
ncbi:alcohol dehydrogenase [Streptomyces sp. SID5476]|uniref:Alcohol dehydrogenase n=1 Tax=Streptomyces bottropensis ATCC 25435 TaxID=1054862 RepID=M3FGH2_9ACTN|nr:alcohol dehydrogenase [Streptomyces bottropensis ATCC 25435]MZD22445.1 alcohol dehydrogenase [Streptomyces sp. SID5476]